MSTAAEWARISPYACEPHEDVHSIGALSVTNLSWSQQQQTMSHAPMLGGRRQWRGYAFELTGYGALELCGPLAYRVSIVHPDDAQALRQLHRLVCTGRLQPAWYRRRLPVSHVHILERGELSRTHVDARGSWLFAAQAVARLCGTDDQIAQLAGPALRRLLWTGREQLDSEHLATALNELRLAADELATERRRYGTALDRRVCGDPATQNAVQSLRLEAQVLAEVRREWEPAPGGTEPGDAGMAI